MDAASTGQVLRPAALMPERLCREHEFSTVVSSSDTCSKANLYSEQRKRAPVCGERFSLDKKPIDRR